MKEHWLETLEWIQLAITLLFLVAMIGICAVVVRHSKLEFNRLWKTRASLVMVAMLWVLCLLLGRQQLWQYGDGLLDSKHQQRVVALCRAYVFLTFGVWQPLFFLIVLMILRAKQLSKLQLHADDTNKYVLNQALLWCIPITAVHIVILALSSVHESDPIVWATYSYSHRLCVIPIISTGATAIFYGCFVIFYILSSRKLFTRLINQNLRKRIRWTQLFFIFVFPLEIVIRFVLIFIPKFEKPYEALYHTYFFLDLIVCTVAVLEFVLLPVLEAASFPLMTGVTDAACKDYEESEESRKTRKHTRPLPALQRVLSEDGLVTDQATSLQSNTKANSTPRKALQSRASMEKPVASPAHNYNTFGSIGDNYELENNANLNVTLTAMGTTYPTDLEDIFANMDDESAHLDNHDSLTRKVDGVLPGDHVG